MPRFPVLVSLLAALVVLAGLLAPGPAVDAVAQEATPTGDGFELPEGVTFEGLAFGLAEALPPGTTALTLYRAGLEPGARVDLAPDPSYFLVYVESGAITFRVDAPALVSRAREGTPAAQGMGPEAAAEEVATGAEVMLRQGDAALFAPNPGGGSGEACNDGAEPAVTLGVSAGPAGAGGAGEGGAAAGTPAP